MPAPVATDETRNPSLLTALFWVGVALAPVAALILLVADGNGPLRFAAVLAILAVVLIGLSIALRADGGDTQGEQLREEIEQLRRELRGEIVAAAQRGNQALDQAQRAQETVGVLRRRLDGATAALAGLPEPESAGRARVPGGEDQVENGRWGGTHRADEVPAAGRADTYPTDRPATGSAGVYGGDRSGGTYGGDRPAGGTYGGDRSGGTYGGDRPASGYGTERAAAGYGPWPTDDGQPGPRPLGVVRHTETVHVTTRHTVVDGAGPVLGETGTRYGGYAGRRSPGPEERPWAGDGEDHSWSGQADADDRPWSGRDERNRPGPRDDRGWIERDEPARPGQQWDDRGWPDQRDDPGWAGEQSWDTSAEPHGRGWSTAPDGGGEDGEYWSQVRADDRWAAVREDGRGRELRMGERRAEGHADHTGTEFRVADRWASVRRDEPARDREGAWRGSWTEPEDRPALPAGGVAVPDEWRIPRQREPEAQWSPEPARYGYPPQGDAPRAGGGTRAADRWR